MRPQTFKALAFAASLAPLAVSAWPTMPSLHLNRLTRRGGYEGVGAVLTAVKDFLRDRNAWDTDVPSKCVLITHTVAGAGCNTSVTCTDTYQPTYFPWNVCYLNGRQFFTHPDLGDFSITYTKAGGVDGDTWDGLHNPVLQMANLNNWEEMDLQKIADDSSSQSAGRLCTQSQVWGTPVIENRCGLPMVGTAGFGMSNFPPPSTDAGFTPGWCTMHVVQHQRNEFGVGADYAFDVIIYDANKKEIGLVQLASIDANTKSLSVTSSLPYTVDVIAAGDDNAPVVFKYADQTWQSGDGSHQSSFGNGPDNGFENGNREGDMGFTC